MLKQALAIAIVIVFSSASTSYGAQNSAQDEACEIIPATVRSFSQTYDVSLLDAAREFVYANSEHADGDAFVTSADPYENVDALCRAAEGMAVKPLLLCGHRAQALQSILSDMGIRTRTVYLFSEWDGPQTLYGHAFIEALNPITGRWEVQDPDFNVAYENQRGRRLSIAEIVAAQDREALFPTNRNGRGWDVSDANIRSILEGGYFSVAFVPAAGMLYYDRIGGETGLVTRVGEYIQQEMPGQKFTSALLGKTDD